MSPDWEVYESLELKLLDGEYVPGPQGPELVSGQEELAQRVLMRLTARRGAFPLLPEYGSRLYALPQVKASQRALAARQYAAEALAEETELVLTDVELLSVSEEGSELRLWLEYQGQPLRLQVEI